MEQPWTPTEDSDLTGAITQAIGAASMCWEWPGQAGVFDSGKAIWVAEGLERWLRDYGYVE